MVFISVMTPALQCESEDAMSIQELCCQTFGNSIELFQLVPITEESEIYDNEIVVRLNQSEFSMNKIEEMITQNEQLTVQLEKSQQALQKTQQELEQQYRMPDKDKNKKFKQLEQDNKKLRHLLKQQLENSENLRLETQMTVETLREEFNMLVKELVNFKGTSFKHDYPLKIESRKEDSYERRERQAQLVQSSVQQQQSAGSRIPKLNMASINT